MLTDHIGIPQLRDLASRSEQVNNSIRVTDMPRLAELLHPDIEPADKALEVKIKFLGGPQGALQDFPVIQGHLKGSLDIHCQRCLGPLAWPADIKFRLTVIGSIGDLDKVAEPFDAIVAGEHGMQLKDVLEDELLGSLPLAPMHADITNCASAIGVEFIENDIESSVPDSDTNRPFEGLAGLLKPDHSSGNND
ncbi:MAG: hypothetical protein GY886_08080 [Gammaproteobacteria bacterium]|nr:hypothetical protein [Gammaproteobacteria bacterium]